MRICVISSSVFSCPPINYAGLEMIAWQQAKGLAERKHEVHLIAPQGSSCPGVNVVQVGLPGQWDEHKMYDEYWKFLVQANFNQDSVIFDHSWQKNSIRLKMEGRLPCPILLWLHAPVETMFQSAPPIPKPCFVAISKNQAANCQSHLKHPARICYNGIDLSFYAPMGLPRTKRYLFLARFSKIKGPDIAIRVAKQAAVELDLIGDDRITNEPELLANCKRQADGKQIKFVGPQNRGDCVWWFNQAHALLHPNRHFCEPFGLSPVESQACKTPVICWNNGAMSETVCNNETGFIVESEEQMTELVKTNAVGVLSRDRCRDWASQFSEQNMVKRCEELATEALNTGGW